jgi:hypothetical protein
LISTGYRDSGLRIAFKNQQGNAFPSISREKHPMDHKGLLRCISLLLGIGAAVLALSPLSSAELGGGMNSVAADQARMKATVRSTQKTDYAVHELQADSGTVIREYVSSAGKVFAVAWSGPFLPNLRQILGTYFTPYSEALRAAKAHHPGRGPALIQQPGLVVQSGGHMRAFSGRAYVPQMLPQSVTAEEIR